MIIISPWSRNLRTGGPSPKNYAYWPELVNLLKDYDDIIQIGAGKEEVLVKETVFNQSLDTVTKLINQCNFWISVDNFLQHMCNHIGKRGVVLWGPSNPDLFGYKENLNIVKSPECFRPNQFVFWETCEPNIEAWYKPEEVIYLLKGEGFIK